MVSFLVPHILQRGSLRLLHLSILSILPYQRLVLLNPSFSQNFQCTYPCQCTWIYLSTSHLIVCKDCSWALHIKALVHLIKSLFHIHLHVLFSSLPSTSLANYTSILFSVHSCFLCSSLIFLNSVESTVSTCVKILFVLTAASKGSILFLTYRPRLFLLSSHCFHSISPLPPFFLETTSLLWYNSLFIVIDFLIFLFISWGSFLFHFSITATYFIMETTQVFNAMILFLPFSLFNLIPFNFALLKYSYLNLSFVSCSFFYHNIPRYLYPSSSISLIFSPLGNSI